MRFLLCLFSVVFVSCSYVPAGNVGIIVSMYGNDKGVSEKVVGPGKYYVGMNEKLYTFPTFSQNYVYSASPHEGKNVDESISFQDRDGLSINGDFGVTYNIIPEKVSLIFQKYRGGVEEITAVALRNSLRDSLIREASLLSIDKIYGESKQEFLNKVLADTQKEMSSLGVNIDKIYCVGDFRLPAVIIEAINAKISAVQIAMRVQNEIAQAEASAKKKAIESQAQADANLKLAKSLTPEYIQYLWIQKWNGNPPQAIGANAGMLWNMK